MFAMAALRLWFFLLAAFCLGRAVWGQDCNEFASPPQETAALIGGMACLQCDYNPANEDEFWERDGTAIRDDNINDVCNCELGIDREFTTLCFLDVSMDDLGDYVCVQQTGFGNQMRCAARLVLADAPEINRTDTSAIEVAEGGSLVVEVTLTNPGNPPADVTFEKDGQPVNSVTDSRVSVDTTPTMVTLTITNAEVSDRGDYVIVAKNALNQTDMLTRTVNIKFISEITIDVENGDGQTVLLTCRATVYPLIDTMPVYWEEAGSSDIENEFREMPGPEVSIVSNLEADVSLCGSEDLRFLCVITNEVITRTKSVTPPCTERPSFPAITVTVESPTAFRVDWDSISTATRYVIEYRPAGTEDWIEKEVDDTGISSYSVSITGVMTNVEYELRAASGNNAGLGNYSTTQTVLIGLQFPITGVSATLTAVGDGSGIKITWQESGDRNVVGYRVFIFPAGGVPFSEEVEGASNTEYVLSDLTCGTSYSFNVQAYNDFADGPNSSTVEHVGCVIPPTVPVVPIQIDNIIAFETALTVSWTILPPRNQQTLEGLLIRLREIDQDTQEFKFTFNYVIERSIFRMTQQTCVGDLRAQSRYEVCIFANFSGTMSEEMNCNIFTTNGTDTAAVSSCLKPTSVLEQTGDESRSSIDTIPDWLIALIVVVILVIIALIFCFIGICFACHTNKRKSVDFGSTSSIPTEIVNDRRSMSPPGRSCLSYHKSGHSTTWSDHVDTIRQLDSGAATSV